MIHKVGAFIGLGVGVSRVENIKPIFIPVYVVIKEEQEHCNGSEGGASDSEAAIMLVYMDIGTVYNAGVQVTA